MTEKSIAGDVITFKEMCEFIHGAFPERFANWEVIWNLSPSGELWPLYSLFNEALLSEGFTINETVPQEVGPNNT